MRVEKSAILTKMTRWQWLTLACYLPSIDFNQKDTAELTHFILQNIIYKQHWYKVNSYYADPQFKTKLNALIIGIICQLSNPELTAKRVYKAMGITKQAYDKTWAIRHQTIAIVLQNWLMTAGGIVQNNCKY